MAYLVRIQRQRAQSTTRGWQVRAYWDNPRYVSRFFAAADHGGMARAKAAAEAAKPEVEREAALRRREHAMTATAYPLTWPPGFPRSARRERGPFKTPLAGALKNVEDSLRRFASDSGKKLEGLVLSSNVTLGSTKPADPGVAVWFTWDGMQVCIAVDRYDSVEANLQAIHHIIEARRVELRHGTLALVRASFHGFLALPAPPGVRDWWDVLQCKRDASEQVIRAQYQRLASERHPDKGGTRRWPNSTWRTRRR